MFWHIWPFQWNTFLPIWEKCLVPSIWRVYIKKNAEIILRDIPHHQLLAVPQLCLLPKVPVFFWHWDVKFQFLDTFWLGPNYSCYRISHFLQWELQSAFAMEQVAWKKNSCSSTLSASYWWMVPVSRTPIATVPNSKLPHSSLSLSLSMASADPHFLVIEYFQMGPFSALRCHSCSFPSFRTG